MRPLCIRIARNLQKLESLSYLPRLDEVPHIEWDRRGYNELADDAANIALDTGRDWMYIHQVSTMLAKTEPVNFRICFDGAKRSSGNAAAGIAFLSYGPNGSRDLLLRAGKLLGQLDSAFLAEALSLEWALDVFFSVVCG